MRSNDAIAFLHDHSVFWSKLGFCYDQPRMDKIGKPIVFFENFDRFSKFHRDFADAGVKIHTSILFNGWIGVDRYDYELTDRVLDAVLKGNPDIFYIPRIKLNVPLDWGKQNPEDVFVYYNGPRAKEEIRSLVGTEKHDYLGYESANGYYTAGGWNDDRPNVGGLISNQSFSSKKWLSDAGIALQRLLDHLENGPYGNQLIAYHIAYGACGETCLWGRSSGKHGDYGINNRRAFFDWGMTRYGSIDAMSSAWSMPGLDRENCEPPSPERRQHSSSALRDFLRADDRMCIDHDLFMSDVNVNAIEHFGKLVKAHTGNKPVGCFYGYMLECFNASYSGWLGIERILNSKYVDFIAAPKSYRRCEAGESGGEIGPAQSINRRKLWMDELDNRTHIAHGVGREFPSSTMDETRTVMWREFAKNMAHGSGFWWMDLGGGWFDSPDIMQEIAKIEKTANDIRRTKGASISEILLVVDEETQYHQNMNHTFHQMLMQDYVREANLCGAPVDMYRLADLETLDMSQYRLIIFLNTFVIENRQWALIEDRIPTQATLLWNYAPAVLGPKLSLQNAREITGFTFQERSGARLPITPSADGLLHDTGEMNMPADSAVNFPLLEVLCPHDETPLARYLDGGIAVASRVNTGRRHIYSAMPLMKAEHVRKIAETSGCHMYAPLNCTVYADSRFIAVFPKVTIDDELRLKEPSRMIEVISGTRTETNEKIPLTMQPKSAGFYIR